MTPSVTLVVLGLALALNTALATSDESTKEQEIRELLTKLLEDNIEKRQNKGPPSPSSTAGGDFITSSVAASSKTGQIPIGSHKSAKKNTISTFSDCPAHAPYRRLDGRCNNPVVPERGSTIQPFKRILDNAYDDGNSSPRQKAEDGKPLPSPRAVSTKVHKAKSQLSSDSAVLLMQWGQFIDHDLTATPLLKDETNLTCCEGLHPGEIHPDLLTGGPCFPIPIPENDAHFQKTCMEFIRSAAASGTTTRQQINLLTSFLDASMVYGLTGEQSQELRQGAYLKTMGDNLLPKSNEIICLLENADDWCFAAGDDRVNVFPGLTVLHTILMREHNRLVKELSDILPESISPDELFEEARKIVGAIVQHITYTEWLPVVLGPEAMSRFHLNSESPHVYDETVDPTIANVFATAAFRYGHSTIPRFLRLRGKKIFINDLFNRPTEVIRDLDAVLEAILMDRRQTVDRFVTDMMTEHLFETSENDGFDVASLNIQRGRDHGLPPYNSFRCQCDLPRITSFDDMDHNAGKSFSKVYTHPDDIDVFSGAVSESPVEGGAVGPLLACLIGKQFADIKYGDSYWYETTDRVKGFTKEQLSEIKRMSLGKLLCDNSEQSEIQKNPLKVYSRKTNPMVPCCDLPTIDLTAWKRG